MGLSHNGDRASNVDFIKCWRILMTSENNYSTMPEDAGDYMQFQMANAREFLKPHESFEQIFIAGRLSEEEANAFIQHHLLGMKYRSGIAVQEIILRAMAPTGRNGEARLEAKEVAGNQISTRGYDGVERKEGKWGGMFKRRKDKEEDKS